MNRGLATRILAAAALAVWIGPLARPAAAAQEPAALLDPTGIVGPLLASEGPLGLLLDLAEDTAGWVDETVGSLLSLDSLFPGTADSAAFAVRNDTADRQPLSLRIVNLRNDDNGCTPPEANGGDTGCGANQGELADLLQITIRRDPELDGTYESDPVFSGTVRRLASGTALAAEDMPAWAEWAYRIETELPGETGNEVQSDQIAFDLRFILGDEDTVVSAGNGSDPLSPVTGSPVDVSGGGAINGASPPSLTERLRGTLPKTGAGIAGVILTGWALTASGLTARLFGRRRRTDSHPGGTDPR